MHQKKGVRRYIPDLVFLGLPALLFLFVMVVPLLMSVYYSYK